MKITRLCEVAGLKSRGYEKEITPEMMRKIYAMAGVPDNILDETEDPELKGLSDTQKLKVLFNRFRPPVAKSLDTTTDVVRPYKLPAHQQSIEKYEKEHGEKSHGIVQPKRPLTPEEEAAAEKEKRKNLPLGPL